MSRPHQAVDEMLRRVPEAAPAAPVSPSEVMTARGAQFTHVPGAVTNDIQRRLATDRDARRLFAHFDARPDERQMRRAIELGLAGPRSLPRARRWPWALGGGILALALVFGVMLVPNPALPDFAVELTPAPEDGLVRVFNGQLTLRLRPMTKPSQPLQAQVFIGHGDGLYRSGLSTRIDADGVVHVDAPIDQWFQRYGRYSVHVALMPKGRVLAVQNGRLVDRHLGQAGVRWLSQAVLYQPESP